MADDRNRGYSLSTSDSLVQSRRGTIQSTDSQPFEVQLTRALEALTQNHKDLARTCKTCGNLVSPTEARETSQLENGVMIYLCYGCSMLTEDQREHHNAPYWSAIFHHWRGDDVRSYPFVCHEQNTVEFLICLHQLSKYYSYEDVTMMVNSIAMERIRHGWDKRRCVVEGDFYKVLEACQQMDFDPLFPDAITTAELDYIGLSQNHFGLIDQGLETEKDEEVMGVCSHNCFCPNIVPGKDRIIFTWAYRNRRGCDIIAYNR
ncbi:hypothetical protein F4804DRAFT_329973 [Jackrogersella minutella]|nr:hypothetical protein F4804DRAFT_329973 [Jackrogersella minutella]